jgi:hypothetical protein
VRRLTDIAAAIVLSLVLASPAFAAGGHGGGFLSPYARAHGHTLVELATAWAIWGFSTPADDNPLVARRCEQRPLDARIWFLPVSFGGEEEANCTVPEGACLVFTAGG